MKNSIVKKRKISIEYALVRAAVVTTWELMSFSQKSRNVFKFSKKSIK